MEAAEDPEDAQLWWPQRRHDNDPPPGSSKHRSQKLAGTFDLFEDIPVGVKELEGALPPTVQVHDIAADDDIPAAAPIPGDLDDSSAILGSKIDLHMQYTPCAADSPRPVSKQYQDDLSTPCLVGPRTLWADVMDDEDVDDHPFDAIAEEAAADADSHEHHSQCGPFNPCTGPHEPAFQAGLHSPQTSRTKFGPLSSDGFEAIAFLPGGTKDPCPAYDGPSSEGGQAGNLPQRRQRTQCGPLPWTSSAREVDFTDVGSDELCALGYSDSLGYDLSLSPQSDIQRALHSGMHVDFWSHSRDVLPDVFPGEDGNLSVCSDAEDSTEGTQCGPLPHGHALLHSAVGETPRSHEEVKQRVGSPRTSLTQCGPLPLDHDHGFFPDFDGFTIFDLDGDGCFVVPDSQGHDSGTQCGPLPQHLLGSHPFESSPQSQSRSKDFGSLGHDLGTQCGHLPQQFCGTLEDTLVDMKSTLAHLVTAASVGTPIDDRFALLAQYEAATRRFELWDQAQYAPPAMTSEPLPIALGPSQAQQAPNLEQAQQAPFFLAQSQSSSHSTSLRTQCGPLPQAATSRLKDFNSKTLPTPRTQYGPLPRQPKQAARTGLSAANHMKVSSGKSKCKGKGKGKGIGNGMPP